MAQTLRAIDRTRPGRVWAGATMDIRVTFEDWANAATDPTTVTCTSLKPDGTETTYTYGTDSELTKSSTGNYMLTITASQPGQWGYRWLTTGTGTTTALEGAVHVMQSAFVDDAYALKDYR